MATESARNRRRSRLLQLGEDVRTDWGAVFDTDQPERLHLRFRSHLAIFPGFSCADYGTDAGQRIHSIPIHSFAEDLCPSDVSDPALRSSNCWW
jgi:hypothetical protein